MNHPSTASTRRPGGGSRRLNGHGTVFHVASENRWKAQFYDRDGRRRTLTARTRAEAETRLRRATTERDAGTPVSRC